MVVVLRALQEPLNHLTIPSSTLMDNNVSGLYLWKVLCRTSGLHLGKIRGYSVLFPHGIKQAH